MRHSRCLPVLLVLLILAFLHGTTTQGQTAVLIRDIAPGIANASSSPAGLTDFAGKLFFTADVPGLGREPWITDGTPGKAVLLADICPDSCSSNPVPLARMKGLLLFAATNGSGGQLWRTDGTPYGTFPLAFYRGGLAVAGEVAYFPVCDYTTGCHVWRTDGTSARTGRISDLTLSGDPGAPCLAALAGRLYFFASDADGTLSLWSSDGGAAGMNVVRALPNGAAPYRITAAAGRLFFLAADDGDQGEELWTSDGTAAGTRPLTRFVPAEPFAATRELIPGARGVYFAADDGLHGVQVWASDGTAAGTVRVTGFTADGPFGTPWLDPTQLAEVDGRLLIAADGGDGFRLWSWAGRGVATLLGSMEVSPFSGLLRRGGQVFFRAADAAHGFELWRSDGTLAGTRMVRDICPGRCDSQLAGPRDLLGQAVFLATDPGHGPQVWTTDGTAAGTHRVTSLPAGAFEPFTFEIAALGSQLFFPATDGQHGEELWTAGGRAFGGRLMADLAVSGQSSTPRGLTPLKDRLVFRAGGGLWSTAGAPETTVPASSSVGCLARDGTCWLTAAGPWAYFVGWYEPTAPGQYWLWRTDGTPAGTLPLAPDTRAAPVAWMGLAAFAKGYELWASDGTVAGTRKAVDLPDGASNLYGLTALGQDLYFGGNLGLFHADGLASAATLVSAEPHFDWSSSPHFTRAGSLVYFVASDEVRRTEIWRTDGSQVGTFPISIPEYSDESVLDLTEYKGRLYFFTGARRGLWRTDGTAEGTVFLHEFYPEYDSYPDEPTPSGLTVALGRLVFAANDGEHGRELWTSDGTPEGTVRVAATGPGGSGPIPSAPSGLTAAAGRLWFSAGDPVHGRELWTSDGSAAGTRLVQDIAPGIGSSDPQELLFNAGRLWFSADDGLTGRELWSLPLGDFGCHPTAERLCLSGGRFAITVDWRDRAGQTGTGKALSITGNAGAFWLTAPENLEIAVKILDGRPVNQSFWIFYGGLTDQEYWLTITDTVTGLTRRYANPPGTLASAGDTRGFGPWGPYAPDPTAPPLRRETAAIRAVPAACVPTPTRLWLQGNRFAVEARWRDFAGKTGTATAIPLTAISGAFWFTDPTNPELVTKLLDGRPVNGKFWFFSGALTNLEYTLTVTDTATGAVRTWSNPSGRFASVGDIGAF